MTKEAINPNNIIETVEQSSNLVKLAGIISRLEDKMGQCFTVTSGLRTPQDQMRINPLAPNSAHLIGMAVDVADPKHIIYDFCVNNVQFLIDNGIWVEDERYTPSWTHLQTRPTIRRFFSP